LALGNLEPHRDWGYAKDYVEAMWLMLQHDTPGEWVVGTGKTHSIEELVYTAFLVAGLDWHDYVTQDPKFMRPHTEITPLLADASKAKKDLGWEPKTTFVELVEMMVEADLKRVNPYNVILAKR